MMHIMANRHIARRILIAAAVSFVLILFYFIQPSGPLSPAIRAPGHIDHSALDAKVKDETLKGEVVMPKLANETAKAELGRATWKYFHTLLGRYPESPSEDEKDTLRSFVYLFARLYPCGECAQHFQQHLKKYPPQVSSRNAAAGWGCFIHNEVNTMLKKPLFDCNNLGDAYDCGCGHEEEEAKGADGSQSDVSDQKSAETGGLSLEVEISKEPTTRG